MGWTLEAGKHYDAENKQIEVLDNSVTVGEYSSDGDGKRIKKPAPGTGELTVFIYDAGIDDCTTDCNPSADVALSVRPFQCAAQ